MKTAKKIEGQHFVDSLCLRLGCELKNPSSEAVQLAERSLPELARLCRTNEGLVVSVSDHELVRSSFSTAGSLYSDVLGAALNKSFLNFYDSAESTWRRWCNPVDLANLFGERIEVDPVASPPKVGPGKRFPRSVQDGSAETILLSKYGQIFDVTFEMILNDDADLIQRLLKEHVQACIRLENDLCYATLEAPGNVGGKAFFHVDHNNLKTGSALSADTLAVAMAQLRNMKANDVELRLKPVSLLVPPALEKTARAIVVTLYNRDADPDRLEVVAEGRLDFSTTSWYLVADKNQTDSLVMGFLQGEAKPRIDQVRAFEIDGKRFRVKHTAGSKAVRPAGIIKNTT